MAKSDDLKSRINLAPKTKTANPGAGGEVAAPRTKPFRVTSDLSPREYRELTDFAAQTAQSLNRPRVPLVEVHRALLAELHIDNDLAARVISRIETQLNT